MSTHQATRARPVTSNHRHPPACHTLRQPQQGARTPPTACHPAPSQLSARTEGAPHFLGDTETKTERQGTDLPGLRAGRNLCTPRAAWGPPGLAPPPSRSPGPVQATMCDVGLADSRWLSHPDQQRVGGSGLVALPASQAQARPREAGSSEGIRAQGKGAGRRVTTPLPLAAGERVCTGRPF